MVFPPAKSIEFVLPEVNGSVLAVQFKSPVQSNTKLFRLVSVNDPTFDTPPAGVVGLYQSYCEPPMMSVRVTPCVRFPGSSVVTSRLNGENFSATIVQIAAMASISVWVKLLASPSIVNAGMGVESDPAPWTALPFHVNAGLPSKSRNSFAVALG